MTKSCLAFVRFLQSAVLLMAIVSLFGIFKPVPIAGKPSLVLESSYAIIAAMLLTSGAAIYSGVMCALEYRSANMSIKMQMMADCALTMTMIALALVFLTSDDLWRCTESINVRCECIWAAVIFFIVSFCLY
ncbi:hypothetical protein AaE_000524 [Aphanomyces astaci]|uniref:MARVEL domain-containing protein n=1 Tax=Aphanomyces astaci TaxID=112090 RepID=A0A6A5AU18_APHAT|nr:hypothetical protein AaE_000524 [Aphanomyces astaci]